MRHAYRKTTFSIAQIHGISDGNDAFLFILNCQQFCDTNIWQYRSSVSRLEQMSSASKLFNSVSMEEDDIGEDFSKMKIAATNQVSPATSQDTVAYISANHLCTLRLFTMSMKRSIYNTHGTRWMTESLKR